MDSRSQLNGGRPPDELSNTSLNPLSYVPDRLPLASRRYRFPDSVPRTDEVFTERSQKRRRVDSKLANDTYFACPFYQADPLKFGGPKGCAGWCTPDIHRVYTDHLQKHQKDGHLSKESIVKIKKQLKTVKEPSSTEMGMKKRGDLVYCYLHRCSPTSDLPSPYYAPIQNAREVLNIRDEAGQTTLHRVSASGDARTVEALITLQASLDIKDHEGRTPLMLACENGHELVTQVLLQHGADVNAQGGDYNNALQVASRGGHTKVVKLLLDCGAEVNKQGGLYENALQAASIEGHEYIVQLLLDKGAEVNRQGGLCENALRAASIGGYEKIVQLLLDKGAEVNRQGGIYDNALQAAIRGRHKQVEQLLRANGAQTERD